MSGICRRGMPPNSSTGTHHDIRNFMTPPPRPPRNRRIIESDSSEELDLGGGAAQAQEQQRQQSPRTLTNALAIHEPRAEEQSTIVISDSSDSMYVPANRYRNRPQQSPDRNPNTHVSRPSPNQRNTRSTPQRQPHTTAQHQQQRTPQRARTMHRQSLIGEAEESTAVDDSEADADESDEDAVALYRSAILGVRNRPNARQQVNTHRNTIERITLS